MTKRENVSEALRRLITESGLSRYEISKRAGVPQSALSRFMSGERTMNLLTADKLADVLDVELRFREQARSPALETSEVNENTVFRDPFTDVDLDPRLRELLSQIADRIVVVGSTARRAAHPKDLDLLLDEKAEGRVRRLVRKLNLSFDSAFPGSWTFGREYGLQVELLPLHQGPDYATTRRRSSIETVAGLRMRVAAIEDAL